MPRVGISTADQSQGSSGFTFAEGVGMIVACTVANHAIPGYEPRCGYKISIQRLDPKLQPTGDEPIEEFLAAGQVKSFHPGRASSDTDSSPDLEWGGGLDCGPEDGAEGTVLLSIDGTGPQGRDSSGNFTKYSAKLALFADSCEQHGVKKELLNGYAPNLVGMVATFTQKMLEKSEKGKDVTCLIVGKGGAVAGGKVYQYPGEVAAQGGAALVRKTPAPPAKSTATAKANGAPAPATTAAPATEPAGNEEVENLAVQMLGKIHKAAAGKTLEKAKFLSRLPVLFASEMIDSKFHTPIKEQIKKDDWFAEKAEEFGWTIGEGGSVTIPKSA
jgi:hypothetical protein